MSTSKLESLPNEILADILEKYLNGIDVIKAFAFQLNRRFDALIAQCQRLRFDFIRCHKDDFCLCMGLLPAYIEKIEELALSEQSTPGQIHAFLSFYPSFDVFERLRRLYFHVDIESVEQTSIQHALRSLSKINLGTLSIRITDKHKLFSLDNVLVELFRMKTLKKLSIDYNADQVNWELLDGISSNIEYLAIHGISCHPRHLINIFRCASGLKYCDIQISAISILKKSKQKLTAEDPVTQMPMLHTAIFRIEGRVELTFIQLIPYLRNMASLHRLEIKIRGIPKVVNEWATVLHSSLPSLTYFTLECSEFRLTDVDVNNILTTIQTSFWIEKQNFNIIVKQLAEENTDRFHLGHQTSVSKYRSHQSVVNWWIAPHRQLNDNLSTLNKIFRLQVSTESSSLFQGHHLDNVVHLAIHELDDNLLQLLTTYVNCSRVKHLDVSLLKHENNTISLFLSNTKNIISVRMTMHQLFDSQFAALKECRQVKTLDICGDRYSFDEKSISVITNTFPDTEHLIINVEDLRNVPLLQSYLPSLRSLTVTNTELCRIPIYDDYRQKMWDVNLRRKSSFLFRREATWLTIWTDQTALQDSFWQTTKAPSKSSMANTRSKYLFTSSSESETE